MLGLLILELRVSIHHLPTRQGASGTDSDRSDEASDNKRTMKMMNAHAPQLANSALPDAEQRARPGQLTKHSSNSSREHIM
jgi:hypothetical protein